MVETVVMPRACVLKASQSGLLLSRRATMSVLCRPDTLLLNNNQLTGTVPTQLATMYPVNSTSWSSTCMLNVSQPNAGCDLAERDALVDLYVSTGGLHWIAGSQWLTTSHPCAWFGVGCAGGSTANGPVVYVPCSISMWGFGHRRSE